MADNATTETPSIASGFRSSHWIAKPVALKSNGTKLRQATDSLSINSSSCETMHDPSKNLWVWPPKMPEPLQTSFDERQRIDPGVSPQTSNDFRNSLFNNLSLWRSGARADATAPSVGQGNLLKTMSEVRQTHPPRVLSEKRSAFREVGKRRSDNKRQCSETGVTEACGTKPNEGLQNVTPNLLKKTETLDNRKSAPFASFCDPTQNITAVPQNSQICAYHNITAEPQEAFGSTSLPALKSQPRMDFLNNSFVVNEHAKAAFGTQFGPLRYFSPVERSTPNLTFSWQQPLVPANVLPLSSSVSAPHLDNWCAKCNASFRMTSDLVYHMRTQHKRSVDCPDGGTDAPAPSLNSSAVKRTDEAKLKCERCGEMFRERHHLTRHMTSHNDTDCA